MAEAAQGLAGMDDDKDEDEVEVSGPHGRRRETSGMFSAKSWTWTTSMRILSKTANLVSTERRQ